MWNYLKGLLRNGSLPKKILIVALLAAIVVITVPILDTSGTNSVAFFAAIGYWFYRKFGKDLKENITDINTVPYWGNKFGLQNCITLLAEDKFEPYIDSRGKKIRDFKISKSGRWFQIKGHYYPSYLVYDYNTTTAKLTMIDGTQVDAGDWKYDFEVISSLEEYLNNDRTFRIDDAYHVRINHSDCSRAFKRAFNGSYDELATADWDRVRYKWEQELSEILITGLNRMDSKKHAEALRNTGIATDAMLTRVLMDDEIDEIAYGIKEDEIKNFSKCFKLESYSNDMCINNGVKLLKALGYPKNKIGTQFLFDCLRDIQKPYFEEAVITLEKYPRDELITYIESHVETAHATGDVLWGAGLLYLSRRIGYEISLARPKDKIEAIFHEAPEPIVMPQGRH